MTAPDQCIRHVPILAVHISERAIERAVATLRSGYVGDGPVVREFEGKVADLVQARHAVAVNSGTSALSLALALYAIGPGDEVITTAQTFVATSHVILAAGATPVYADVQYMTGNMDPADIEGRITPRTKAILPVHWAGYPCDMDEILDIATRHALPVIEDAAQAFGAVYRNRPIGSLSSITCFSFQAVKQLTTAEGGMLTLQVEEDFEAARRRRWFGIDRVRRKPLINGYYDYDTWEPGYGYHMTDVTAALGLAHLEDLPALLQRRQAIAARYRAALANASGVRLFEQRDDRMSGCGLFTMHVEERDQFCRAMRERGIQVSVVHVRNDQYTIFGGLRDDLPNLDRLSETYISIPMHNRLTDEDVEYVITCILQGW
jgi:perosamine synthetase